MEASCIDGFNVADHDSGSNACRRGRPEYEGITGQAGKDYEIGPLQPDLEFVKHMLLLRLKLHLRLLPFYYFVVILVFILF